MATQVQDLSQPITGHAFSADRTQVVVCENSNEAAIYDAKSYEKLHALAEHDKLITSVDWAPRSNRIVTCSQDRNAYVWNQAQDGSWKPTLVLLRLNRSATCVKWSPTETKVRFQGLPEMRPTWHQFAVGSGARTIAVCSFDEESDWWVAKQLKKPLRSTVLSIDWHPNGVLLAAGSADSKARVFSAFLKGDDKFAFRLLKACFH
jgi:actin related protein 2/3 complex subunit 1A/1B